MGMQWLLGNGKSAGIVSGAACRPRLLR